MNQTVIERAEVAVSNPACKPFTKREKVCYSIMLAFSILLYLAFMTVYVGSIEGWFNSSQTSQSVAAPHSQPDTNSSYLHSAR